MCKEKNLNKNSVEQTNKRLIYLDILRIISAFAVIVIHTTTINVYTPNPELSLEWIIYVFFDSFSRWAVPVFVMISGSLFLDNTKILNIKTFYKKNIFKIIIAFIFWMGIYILHDKPNSSEELFTSAYHLWFLPMLIGLYIITPVLRKITEDKKITFYFLIVSVLFIVICPTLFNISFFENFEVIHEQFIRGFCVNYSFYFVAGYYLAHKNFSQKANILIYSLGVISFLLLPIITIYSSLKNNEFYDAFLENFSLLVMLQSIFVFVLIKNICNKKFFNKKITKIIIRFSKYTFGIYLVHLLILDILKDFEIIPLSCSIIIFPIITSLLIFLISLLISAILNHIPILKKYIV